MTANVNSHGAMRKLMGQLENMAVVLVQETHMADKETIDQARAWLKRQGWHSVFAEAEKGNGQKGSKGGVGILWKPWVFCVGQPVVVNKARAISVILRSETFGEAVFVSCYGYAEGPRGKTTTKL